jgi:hypothetical protein
MVSKCPLTTPKVFQQLQDWRDSILVQDAEKIYFIGIVFVVVYAMYNI